MISHRLWRAVPLILLAGCATRAHTATSHDLAQLVTSYSAEPAIDAVRNHQSPAPYVQAARDYLTRMEHTRWPANATQDAAAVEDGLRTWIVALRSAGPCTPVVQLESAADVFGSAAIRLHRDLGIPAPAAPGPAAVVPPC